MEKKLVLALALSILIILGLQQFTAKPTLPPAPPTGGQITEKPLSTAAVIAPTAPEPTVPEEEFTVETARYVITFSNIGGAIKGIVLKDFKALNSTEPLGLSRIKNQPDYIFNLSSAAAPALKLGSYAVSKSGDTVTYSIRTGDWDIFKKYVLHNTKRGIELQIFAKNISGAPKEFNYSIIGGAGLSETLEQDKHFIEISSSIDGKVQGFKKPKAGRITIPGAVKWTALKNKCFSLILKPMVAAKNHFYYEDASGLLVDGVETQSVSVQPGATIENTFILYAGPSHIPALKEFGYDLEETINYGFFGGISKALLAALRFFYSIVHSWGVSIILLSIVLNFLLFPLTLKSFSSMQKMQALHPEMEKLKKLHKDNPQKLNKEIMELYKKYKINPLGGCLPMLLQMPIFVALYQALMKSIELRNASFLWIQDLSSPDAVRIPITLPIVGNSINILPLIMVGAMVLQQRMSTKTMGSAVTAEQQQQQKMMLIIMPIMFGFIFYNMPSGLVMYWIINTVLTVIEQAAIMKNSAVEA